MANINYADLFSSNTDDIVEDVYVELMAQMDDKTLLNYCNTHPYNRELCNRDDIWLPRINSVPGLRLLLPYRSHYKNLQDFYFNVRKDAHYVLMDFEYAVSDDVANNTESTFVLDKEATISDVSYNIMAIFNTLQSFPAEDKFLCITIRFNDVLDYNNIQDYIIYSRTERFPNYNNKQILQYPELLQHSYHAAVFKVQYNSTFPDVLTPSDNTSQNNDKPEMSGRIIPRRGERSNQVRHKIAETFIEFDTDSLRVAHTNNSYVRLYKDIVGSQEAGIYADLVWISFGYITSTRRRYTILLIDLALLDLEPAEYGLILTKPYSLNSVVKATVLSKILETPEELVSDQKKRLTELVMEPGTEIFSLTELSRIIDKY